MSGRSPPLYCRDTRKTVKTKQRQCSTPSHMVFKVIIYYYIGYKYKAIKMPNGWRTIKSLVHKIRLHGRRGKGMAESFSREKLRHAPQKEGGWEILCDLPPVWPRLVRPTNLMSRMNGKKTHTHTSRESVSPLSRLIRGFRNKYHWSPLGRINASGIEWLGWQGRMAWLCAI